MTTPHQCPICGGDQFVDKPVLWPELIAAWELSPAEVAVIDRQQGRTCTTCGSNWRSMALADALLSEFQVDGLFREFVAIPRWQTLRVLEINRAGHLTQWLAQGPRHHLVEYPDLDMQRLPFDDGRFDVVIHSDTLEHVPDPLAGLRECRRVLAPGGRCIYTVPQIVGRLTRSCTGRPASYHGSARTPYDHRVHTEFGGDAALWPLQAGFVDSGWHVWDYPSAMAIVARVGRHETPTEPDRGTRSPPLASDLAHRYAVASVWAVGKDVLDIGCGDGQGTRRLATTARSVVGLDRSLALITRAQSNSANNLRFQMMPFPWPLPEASVDLIVSFSGEESVTSLDECRRVLRPDGILLLACAPDSAGDWSRDLESRFRLIQAAGQRHWNGSLVAPYQLGPLLQSITDDGERWTVRDGLPELAAVLIAATNASALPPWPASVYAGPQDFAVDPRALADARSQLQSVLNSRCWKLIAPLRAAKAWLTRPAPQQRPVENDLASTKPASSR
jgi:SAM-dependent methyltransferase